ncbi:MAG: futalosine hydrolase [Phycisphaerales bacterium]|nr:futalosine hydrolase [Phycisphaerales bacterium]
MTLVIVTAVAAEADALGDVHGAIVVAGGVGRTNAAATTTEIIVRRGDVTGVISAGIAGALPGGGLSIGDLVLASASVYVEEGMATPDGFTDMRGLGFPLGDFEGNVVPADATMSTWFGADVARGIIATVATCSGTDEAAAAVVHRTRAIAEAMEGAAVVHAARRLGVPAIEIRAISNTTGHRTRQRWDIPAALRTLGTVGPRLATRSG